MWRVAEGEGRFSTRIPERAPHKSLRQHNALHYIQLWQGDANLLRESLEAVQQTAAVILGGIAQGIAHWALPSVRLLAGCSRGHCTQPYGSGNRYPLQLEFCPAAGTVTGSGTADFVPLWTSSSNIGNSVRFQSDSEPPAKVGFSTSSSSTTLDVPAAEPGSCGFGWRRL